jgi:hypothetical protein
MVRWNAPDWFEPSMTKEPLIAPELSGLTDKKIAQLAPGSSDSGQSLVCAKGAVVEIELMLSGALPLLDMGS